MVSALAKLNQTQVRYIYRVLAHTHAHNHIIYVIIHSSAGIYNIRSSVVVVAMFSVRSYACDHFFVSVVRGRFMRDFGATKLRSGISDMLGIRFAVAVCNVESGLADPMFPFPIEMVGTNGTAGGW